MVVRIYHPFDFMNGIRFLFMAAGALIASLTKAADTPAAVPDNSPGAIVSQWQTDQKEFNTLAPGFANPLPVAQLVSKTTAAWQSSGLPQPAINASHAVLSPGGLFVLNSITVHFANTPVKALSQFVVTIQGDAPKLIIDEMNTAPELADPTQAQGDIRISAIEFKPGATDPIAPGPGTTNQLQAIRAKEELLAQFRVFSGQTLHPFEMLGTINPLRPADVTFSKTRFYDSNKVQIGCVATSISSVTQFIAALSASTVVELDKSKLAIQSNPTAKPPQFKFTLDLAFKTMSAAPLSSSPPLVTHAPAGESTAAPPKPSLGIILALVTPAIILAGAVLIWLLRRRPEGAA